MSDDRTAAAVRARVVIERTYKAQAEELWDLWTTKAGLRVVVGTRGVPVEVHSLEPRVGGRLHYDMLADTPEMVEAMRRMGRPPSHVTRARFVEVKLHEHLTIAHVIDFLPGWRSYESAMRVDLLAARDQVRMVVTLEPMHDEEFTKMSTLGFSSQLTKLDRAIRATGGGNRTGITASRRYTGADVRGAGRGSHDLVCIFAQELGDSEHRALWCRRARQGRLRGASEIHAERPRVHML